MSFSDDLANVIKDNFKNFSIELQSKLDLYKDAFFNAFKSSLGNIRVSGTAVGVLNTGAIPPPPHFMAFDFTLEDGQYTDSLFLNEFAPFIDKWANPSVSPSTPITYTNFEATAYTTAIISYLSSGVFSSSLLTAGYQGTITGAWTGIPAALSPSMAIALLQVYTDVAMQTIPPNQVDSYILAKANDIANAITEGINAFLPTGTFVITFNNTPLGLGSGTSPPTSVVGNFS